MNLVLLKCHLIGRPKMKSKKLSGKNSIKLAHYWQVGVRYVSNGFGPYFNMRRFGVANNLVELAVLKR